MTATETDQTTGRRCPRCKLRYDGSTVECPSDGSPLVIDRTGMTLGGRFVIEMLLAERRGTTTVWLARDADADTDVAVKIMSGGPDDEHRRFVRGARLASRIDHPRVNRVVEMGSTDDGEDFLVLELLRGSTLDRVLAERTLTLSETLKVADDLLDALEFVHWRGFIHRDVKPDNIYVTITDDSVEAILADFGIARGFGQPSPRNRVTQPLKICGTPAYMAPEQITDGQLDPRADLYGLGVTLYRAISGRLPFVGPKHADYYRQKLFDTAPPLTFGLDSQPAHPDVEAFIRKAMAKNAADRFADARAMMAALATLRSRLGET